MAIPAFNPSEIRKYGTSGQETARKMADNLRGHGMSLAYNQINEIFTIFGSVGKSKALIERIFCKSTYRDWKPRVLDETDTEGNKLVAFVAIQDLNYSSLRQELDATQQRFLSEIIERMMRSQDY